MNTIINKKDIQINYKSEYIKNALLDFFKSARISVKEFKDRTHKNVYHSVPNKFFEIPMHFVLNFFFTDKSFGFNTKITKGSPHDKSFSFEMTYISDRYKLLELENVIKETSCYRCGEIQEKCTCIADDSSESNWVCSSCGSTNWNHNKPGGYSSIYCNDCNHWGPFMNKKEFNYRRTPPNGVQDPITV